MSHLYGVALELDFCGSPLTSEMADIQGIQKLVCELKDKKLAENAIAKLAELAGSPLVEGALVQVRAATERSVQRICALPCKGS